MAKSLQEWNPLGKGPIDLDNQSYDCVDIPKSWAEYLTGKSWQTSFCWGNAKDLYNNCPTTYWDKIPRGSQEPKPGDVVVMSGAIGGGYGHTGVVIEVIGGNIKIVQQNTFTQQAPYTGVYDKNASYIIGYLRSKVAFTVGIAAALAGYQRITNDVVNYRNAANRGAGNLVTASLPDGKLKAGDTYDFKGFVRGEAVDGNNIWFVGMYSGGYAWSGGFTDTSTHDLADLTPATVAGNQRQIGSDAMNYRRTALVAPDNVIRVISAGETLTLKGYVEGMVVDGINTWFVYEQDGTTGYVWAGGFKDSGTHDLPNLTPSAPSTPVTPTPTTPAPVDPTPTAPSTPAAYSFTKDVDCVTEVIPAGLGSFEYGNFPAVPLKAVIHDFGTAGRDTIGSTINTFKLKDNISAHFVVSGKRIVQMVSIHNRAYHAGPNGNNFIGIETDPVQDADTIASVRTLLGQLEAKIGQNLPLIKHSSIMATLCGDDVTLGNYNIHIAPVPTPTVPADSDITLASLDQRVTSLEQTRTLVIDLISKVK